MTDREPPRPRTSLEHKGPMRDLRIGTLALAAAALAGCGGGSGSPQLTAAVDTVNGVERLNYPAASAGDLGWGLDTVAVLGDAFADDAYQFDQVTAGALASDAQGNLYLLDRQGHRVLKYSPDGEHLATYGREGEGPGELNQPISLALGPGDTVWVSDFSNTRFTGYPQDGGDARSVPLPTENVIPGNFAAREGGFEAELRPLFGISMSGGRAQIATGGDDEPGENRIPVVRTDRSLGAEDTLWSTVEPPRDMVTLQSGDRVMISMVSREFYPDFQWGAFSDGGIVVSDSASYVLHLIDADGNLVRTITRGPAPRAVTEADKEAARDRVRDESENGIRIGGGGPDEETQRRITEQRIEKMTFADLLPRVVGLRVDPADRIWVAVSEDTPGEMDRIDVYDRDGTLLGELRGLPFPDVFLGPDRVGVLRRDDLDIQQVVILGIHRDDATAS